LQLVAGDRLAEQSKPVAQPVLPSCQQPAYKQVKQLHIAQLLKTFGGWPRLLYMAVGRKNIWFDQICVVVSSRCTATTHIATRCHHPLVTGW
jgi:hypothetical protein